MTGRPPSKSTELMTAKARRAEVLSLPAETLGDTRLQEKPAHSVDDPPFSAVQGQCRSLGPEITAPEYHCLLQAQVVGGAVSELSFLKAVSMVAPGAIKY